LCVMIRMLTNFVFLKMWSSLKINISFSLLLLMIPLQFCVLILMICRVILNILSQELCIRDIVHQFHCMT
jgi:hypothetical protein